MLLVLSKNEVTDADQPLTLQRSPPGGGDGSAGKLDMLSVDVVSVERVEAGRVDIGGLSRLVVVGGVIVLIVSVSVPGEFDTLSIDVALVGRVETGGVDVGGLGRLVVVGGGVASIVWVAITDMRVELRGTPCVTVTKTTNVDVEV